MAASLVSVALAASKVVSLVVVVGLLVAVEEEEAAAAETVSLVSTILIPKEIAGSVPKTLAFQNATPNIPGTKCLVLRNATWKPRLSSMETEKKQVEEGPKGVPMLAAAAEPSNIIMANG